MSISIVSSLVSNDAYYQFQAYKQATLNLTSQITMATSSLQPMISVHSTDKHALQGVAMGQEALTFLLFTSVSLLHTADITHACKFLPVSTHNVSANYQPVNIYTTL